MFARFYYLAVISKEVAAGALYGVVLLNMNLCLAAHVSLEITKNYKVGNESKH